MSSNLSRVEKELAHSSAIRERAEDIWGWSTPAGRLRAFRRAKFFRNLSRMGPQSQVLEIGCGTGLFTELVSSTEATITATDLSEDLLAQARGRHLPNCRFEVANAEHLPYPASQFDIVFGSSILHHLEVKKALGEMKRVLKCGGCIVFAEPNMLNPQILLQKNVPWIKKRLGDSPDETAFFRWQIGRMLREAGMIRVKVFPYDFLHPFTPTFLIPAVRAVGRVIETIPLLREIAGSLVIYAENP